MPPTINYNGLTRLGPNNTPGVVTFTADDANDDPLTHAIRTAANGTGTLVADGNASTGTPTNVNLAHNAPGLVEGTNPLYLRVSDGQAWSDDAPLTVLVDRTPPAVGAVTVAPPVVTEGGG